MRIGSTARMLEGSHGPVVEIREGLFENEFQVDGAFGVLRGEGDLDVRNGFSAGIGYGAGVAEHRRRAPGLGIDRDREGSLARVFKWFAKAKLQFLIDPDLADLDFFGRAGLDVILAAVQID